MAKKPQASSEPETASVAGKSKPKMDFPRYKLPEVLKVAIALEEKNGGQPLPPTDTAIAMGLSPGSSYFRDLLSSSIKYGLTTGSFNGDRIALTTLAEHIVRPRSDEEKAQALTKAALIPASFGSIFQYYKGKKLPEPLFFKNTLTRDLGIPAEFAELCATVFVANIEAVGLIRNATSGKWLASEANAIHSSPTKEEIFDTHEESLSVESLPSGSPTPDLNPPPGPVSKPRKNAIFIGHGRSQKPLQQLKDILDQLGIPYLVAQEEANQGRPISTKVADTLNECGAGILIFSADEEFRDIENNTIWRPRENVIHELGAASVLYGNRIIVFKESSVTLASNFKDIGYIEFEKDNLSAKMPNLLKELVAFGLVRLTVGG